MNSSSIVLSFMLAGFIFLLAHNLIAGPVEVEHTVLKTMADHVTKQELARVQTTNASHAKQHIKTIKEYL